MSKQNWFKIIIIIFLLLPLLGCNSKGIQEKAAESNETPITDFQWELKDGEVTIKKYTGESTKTVIPQHTQEEVSIELVIPQYMKDHLFAELTVVHQVATDVVIPQYIEGHPVTKIGYNAFWGCRLTSVVIPHGVTIIEQGAFRYNEFTSITIPETVTEIHENAFEVNLIDNPLKEIIFKPKMIRLLSTEAFEPPFSRVPLPGTYVLDDDNNWLYQDSDGTLLSQQVYCEKLIKNDPGILAELVYIAVNHADMEMLKDCIVHGADVKSRMLNGKGNTPLAEVISSTWWWVDSVSFYYDRGEYFKRQTDMVAILLEAGAVPQYWMLCSGYYTAAVIKMLLERGALTRPESSEHGDFPKGYIRPESLLLYYCQNLATRSMFVGNFLSGSALIAESAVQLLEYGEDTNYREPNTGRTPLNAAINAAGDVGVEMVELLLKHVSRPLPREEYVSLIALNRKKVYTDWLSNYLTDGIDIEREDRFGFDAAVLKDIRNGLLNPESKDSNGKDIFDYAVEKGTAGLMEGLLPYLLKSKRAIITINGTSVNSNGDGVNVNGVGVNGISTGLYFDAIKAENSPVAAVLSTAMNHKFSAKDSRGNPYSLEHYAYDYIPIYLSAQRILHDSVYRSGSGGVRKVDGNPPTLIHYVPNKLYTISGGYYDHEHKDLSLYTINGNNINLNAVINEQRDQYYRESGKKREQDYIPNWYTTRIFATTLCVSNGFQIGDKNALVDISGGKPLVYFLEEDNLPDDFYSIVSAWHFVIASGKAYSLTSTGEAVVFNISRHSLLYEKTVPWREFRVPGWKDGEWFFISDGIVTAYNISTGAMRQLGKEAEEKDCYYDNYVYEGADGRRYILGSSGNAYPVPDDEYERLVSFDQGYIYNDKNNQYRTVCFFEKGLLKRKIILYGEAVTEDYRSFPSVQGNTLYLGMRDLAFTIDLTSMRIGRTFNTEIISLYQGCRINIFPFGADNMVYSRYYHEGDH